MIQTDQFLDRVPGPDYNCFDFVREVWFELTGVDLTSKLLRLTGRFKERKGTISGRREFERLKEPCTPCVVFMQRRFFEPHVGVWINGRVLHLKDNGVQFQPLPIACGYYKKFSYYK